MTRDYGGAYDIDPQAFFTREEVNEFAEDVCDAVAKELKDHDIRVSDSYITYEDNKDILTVELCADGDYCLSVEHSIDYRTIRKPSDINKMIPIFVYVFVNRFNDIFEEQ